ncbi:MAG: hypothetical protein GXY76_22715 [Chloroflexi bacterium]|nr:hypothetical protein [Chloroflexota bacterium]
MVASIVGLVVAVLGLAGLWAYHLNGASGLPTRETARVVVVTGVIIALASLLWLPAISFLPPEMTLKRAQEVAAKGPLLEALRLVPAFQAKVALRYPPSAHAEQPFARVELEETWNSARTRRGFSGSDLLRHVPITAQPLRFGLWLACIACLLGLAAVAVGWLSAADSAELWIMGVSGAAAVLALILLIARLPTMDTFGLRGDLGAEWLALLLGSRLGFGFWLICLGMLLLPLGGGGLFLLPAPVRRLQMQPPYRGPRARSRRFRLL